MTKVMMMMTMTMMITIMIMRGGECTQKIVEILARSRNLGNISIESQRLVFFLVWFRNRLSLGLRFSNKGLGVLVSLGFYHSPPLL